MAFTSLLNLDDVDREDIDYLLTEAEKIEAKPQKYSNVMNRDILCPIFHQESSRTYFNSTSSFIRMGGTVIPVTLSNTRHNSKWNEPVRDFCTVINASCDLVVFRSPDVQSLYEFKEYCNIPMINAGNGTGLGSEHPVQALLDLYVIKQHFSDRSLNILMIGGQHIRSTRSQIKLFIRYGYSITVLSPPVHVDNADVDELISRECSVIDDVREASLCDYDIIYHNGMDEDPLKTSTEPYKLSLALIKNKNFSGKVMHSLPRKNELETAIDDTVYDLYTAQMHASKFVFMSVFKYIKACSK